MAKDRIDFSTLTPSHVWIGHGDGHGGYTDIGKRLLHEDKELAEYFCARSQWEHTQRYPNLYPYKVPNPGDVPPGRGEGKQVRIDRPKAAPNLEKHLADQGMKLEDLFGSKSNAANANNVAKKNPALYQELRGLAVERGLLRR
jgi:hypothetical protein